MKTPKPKSLDAEEYKQLKQELTGFNPSSAIPVRAESRFQLLSESNVNELRAKFGQFDDYKIASLLISLAAFPDGMAVVRAYPTVDATGQVMNLIHARALALVYTYVSQTPHDPLPDNSGNSGVGGAQ